MRAAVPFFALAGALALLPACRTAAPTPPTSPSTSAGGRTFLSVLPEPPAAAPRLVRDHAAIRVTAQDGSGRIWGLGWLDGDGVAHWTPEGWRKVEDASAWPGSALDVLADPTDPHAVVSLWSGPPQTSGDLSVLHVWRHRAGHPAELQATFPNPSIRPGRRRDGDLPRLALGLDGEVWLTFSDSPVVARPLRDATEPAVLTIDPSHFVPLAGDRSDNPRPLVFTPTAPGEGWLWTQLDEGRRNRDAILPRPLRVTRDGLAPCPPIDGLPTDGRVTLVAPAATPDTTVWAFEGGALFEVSAATMTARPLRPLPGAWRVIDHARPAPGVEVALTVSQKRDATRTVGEIWIRLGDGDWQLAGPSGDAQTTFPGPAGWRLRPRSWLVHDDALLGAGFYSGLVMIDLSAPAPTVRLLGWAEHQTVRAPSLLHRTPDGGLLITGEGALHAAPGLLRAAWEVPATADVFAIDTHPVRAPDGRLWEWRYRGLGGPAVRHWDGAQWHEWLAPAERDWWPQEGLWVDASGRVALLPETPDKPAWERDSAAPDGWRRWESATALIVARAAEAAPALPPVSEGFSKLPVFSGDGRALVGANSGLWLYTGGEWKRFTSRDLGSAPFRYGFEPGPDGAPFYHTNRRKRVLAADQTWVQLEELVEQEPPTGSRRDDWPDWLRQKFLTTGASSAQRDEDGVWWLQLDGELWQGREGDVVRVFADAEPSPFRFGRGLNFFAVHSDAAGNRFFRGSPHVVLPARPGPELRVEVLTSSDRLLDRILRIDGGAGLLHFEWRVGDGSWRRGGGGQLVLRELPSGATTIELRGVNRRLAVGPIHAETIALDYDEAARLAELLAALHAPSEPVRIDAVQRLALRGEPAARALRAALAAETDETRRWWQRAALQAQSDRMRREEP